MGDLTPVGRDSEGLIMHKNSRTGQTFYMDSSTQIFQPQTKTERQLVGQFSTFHNRTRNDRKFQIRHHSIADCSQPANDYEM